MDSDEEEAVYNPLKLPLGFDGKPIPYWLYKLHGLNQVGPPPAGLQLSDVAPAARVVTPRAKSRFWYSGIEPLTRDR